MSPAEVFSDEERARLAPFVTDLDGPVFALVNLPETVKAALFARYSRHPGTLRRLLLDEFAGDLPARACRARRARLQPARPRRPRSTSASSSATATTRSRSSAASTSPASGSPTC